MNLSGKKILIVRLGKIGDLLIASAAFKTIKNKFTDVHLSTLTLKKNKEVLKYNPDIDQQYFISRNIFNYFNLLKLKKKQFDLLLDLNDDPSGTSSLIRKFVKANQNAGFEFKGQSHPDITIQQPDKTKTHIIGRLEKLLNGIGIFPDKSELKPVLYLDNEADKIVRTELNRYRSDSKKNVAINISSGADIREWPEENFIELLRKLVKFDEWNFLILHSRKDHSKAESIIKYFSSSRIIKMKYYSFHHFASYIRNADLVITPDTSAVHICSAFNVPVIALFPGIEWNFVSWQPLSDISKSIMSKEESIKGISVEEVFESFTSLQSKLINQVNE